MSEGQASPLRREIEMLIRHEGPIGLDRYMALALAHPVHGYYTTRDPLGTAGDFTTAPEISQMFGEMIGLWAAEVWRQMGEPSALRLVELGPGRGTLLVDLLRAARAVPGFREALDLHLVESSPVLRRLQAAALEGTGLQPTWHDRFDTVAAGPVLVLANEFFDALPARHYVRTDRGWCERLVGLDAEGELAFGLSPEPEPGLRAEAPPGSVLEIGTAAVATVAGVAARVAQGGAALIIDYGHVRSGFGETLQALARHRAAYPLRNPGEADLTVHVDFAALGSAARAAGAIPHGPVEQGAFLRALGIETRAAQLARSRPDQPEAVAGALERLTGPGRDGAPGMGLLFKVLALTAPAQPVPPGFVGQE